MAGRNAKRRTRAAKAESRLLEMPKSLWEVVASAATLAGAAGVSGSILDTCRKLAAKAEYLLGEAENKAGRIRGELTSDEVIAFRKLIKRSKGTMPQGEMLDGVIRVLESLPDVPGDDPIEIDEVTGEEQRDARMLYRPEVLALVIRSIGMFIEMTDARRISGEQSPGVGLEQLDEMLVNLRSVHTKLAHAQTVVALAGGPPPMIFTRSEVEVLSSAFRMFLETIQLKMVPGKGVDFYRNPVMDYADASFELWGSMPIPETEQSGMQVQIDNIRVVMECAARYFTRKAQMWAEQDLE